MRERNIKIFLRSVAITNLFAIILYANDDKSNECHKFHSKIQIMSLMYLFLSIMLSRSLKKINSIVCIASFTLVMECGYLYQFHKINITYECMKATFGYSNYKNKMELVLFIHFLATISLFLYYLCILCENFERRVNQINPLKYLK